MFRQSRPLSPHLQIYRPQISSIMSIMHRLTGIILTSVPLLLIIWLTVESSNDKNCEIFYTICQSSIGRCYLFFLTYAFFYHLLNGIRHLFWDIGCGFDMKSLHRSGWSVIILSLVLTLLRWI